MRMQLILFSGASIPIIQIVSWGLQWGGAADPLHLSGADQLQHGGAVTAGDHHLCVAELVVVFSMLLQIFSIMLELLLLIFPILLELLLLIFSIMQELLLLIFSMH